MDQRLTVLVMARDQTEKFAGMASYFMDQYWKERNAELVLCTQTKAPLHHSYDRVIYTRKDAPWEERMEYAAEQIYSKYVLFCPEDYFLCSPVSSIRMENCLQVLDTEQEVAVIRLSPTRHFISPYREGFNVIKKGKPYRICGSPTLFRREYFTALVHQKFNPWQFEILGTEYSCQLSGEVLVTKVRVFPCVHAWQYGCWTREAIRFFRQEKVNSEFYKNEPVLPLYHYIIGGVWGMALDCFPNILTNYSKKRNRQN